jgi:hypothetical protein
MWFYHLVFCAVFIGIYVSKFDYSDWDYVFVALLGIKERRLS